MLTTVRAALALQLDLLTLHPATWACSHSQNSEKMMCCAPADARLAPFSCTSAHRGTLLALQTGTPDQSGRGIGRVGADLLQELLVAGAKLRLLPYQARGLTDHAITACRYEGRTLAAVCSVTTSVLQVQDTHGAK